MDRGVVGLDYLAVALLVAGTLLYILSARALGPHFNIGSYPSGVTTSGPYQFLNHPIYWSYTLWYAASVLHTWNPVVIACGGLWLWGLWERATEETIYLEGFSRPDYSHVGRCLDEPPSGDVPPEPFYMSDPLSWIGLESDGPPEGTGPTCYEVEVVVGDTTTAIVQGVLDQLDDSPQDR